MSNCPDSSKFVFGYGSLVNSDTHDYPRLHLARLRGWRRAWRHTPHRDVSFLTAIADPDATIEGALAPVAEGSWEALDQREWAYERHDATGRLEGDVPGGEAVVYAIAPDNHHAPTPEHPILQSYLDAVLAGYHAAYGWDGVQRFIETTQGWDAPLLADRAAPRYPRAQILSKSLRDGIDAHLEPLQLSYLR